MKFYFMFIFIKIEVYNFRISSVSAEDSGHYLCTSSNNVGPESSIHAFAIVPSKKKNVMGAHFTTHHLN